MRKNNEFAFRFGFGLPRVVQSVALSFVLATALGFCSVAAATTAEVSDAPNLNAESMLDLMHEASLPNVRRNQRDIAEFGYMNRSLGRPTLVTPQQATNYDFTTVAAPYFGYRIRVSDRYPLSWSSRLSYFDVETKFDDVAATRLHVLPIQTELFWNFTQATLSPFMAVGAVGILQFQRGAQVESSAFAKLWSGRLGLDWKIRDTNESSWWLSASWLSQKSFAASDLEWAGSGYDISISIGL